MALLKKKISYTDFIGYFVMGLVAKAQQGQIVQQVKLVNQEGILTEDEGKALADELFALSIVITTLEMVDLQRSNKFPQYPSNMEPEEVNQNISRDVMSILGQVYKDSQIDESEFDKDAQNIMKYFEQLENLGDDDIKRGLDFAMTSLVSKFLIGKLDLRDKNNQEKNFFVFNLAMQVTKNTQAGLHKMASDHKVT